MSKNKLRSLRQEFCSEEKINKTQKIMKKKSTVENSESVCPEY